MTRQPILSNAAKTRFALLAGQLLIRNCEGHAERRRRKLIVGDAISYNLYGESLNITDRFVPGQAVTHYAGKFGDVCDPASVLFPIKFDRQPHPFIILPRADRA